MFSIGEEIAKITDPTPEVFDPEDEITNSEKIKLSYTQDSDIEISDLRRKTAPLLEDRDPSYAGKKVSRHSLGQMFQEGDKSELNSRASISSNNLSSSGSEDEDESPDDDLNDEDVAKFKNLVHSQSTERSDEDKQSAEDEDSSEEDDDKARDTIIQQFSNIDVSNEIEKGHAVKNQKEIWNRLLETRIKLQKLLLITNKLPQTTAWEQLKVKGGKDMDESLQKSFQSTTTLMLSLIDFNDELFSRNTEIGSSVINKKSNSDEEICSDTDEEMMGNDINSSPDKVVKKRKYKDCSDVLAKRFKSLVPYRNSVIQKFDEKTRLTTGRITQKSFNAFDNSALKQIDQILRNKTRLIRRTQLKRSLYRVLGKSEDLSADENANVETSKQDMLLKDHDPEIFDDDDFYRQILKDLIESNSFGMDSAVIRKQMEIQKVRNKMKRKVDTKASKGRKLRFDVHPKVVNFMAPVKTCYITDEERESFLKCLFGGKNKSQT